MTKKEAKENLKCYKKYHLDYSTLKYILNKLMENKLISESFFIENFYRKFCSDEEINVFLEEGQISLERLFYLTRDIKNSPLFNGCYKVNSLGNFEDAKNEDFMIVIEKAIKYIEKNNK